MGHLLAYFLGPGTVWGLHFQNVVSQVLRENRTNLERRRLSATTALRSNNNRQATLRAEIDAVLAAMEIGDAASRGTSEHRLSSLQTPLSTVERGIAKYENIIEDCRFQEQEACEEETSRAREEEECPDAEMAEEEEEHVDAGPSDFQREVDATDLLPLEAAGKGVSPEEDALLMQPAPQSEGPTDGPHSPRSEAGTVLGEMAGLSLNPSSQPGPGEDETQQ